MHFYCVSFTESNFTKAKKSQKDKWKCNKCQFEKLEVNKKVNNDIESSLDNESKNKAEHLNIPSLPSKTTEDKVKITSFDDLFERMIIKIQENGNKNKTQLQKFLKVNYDNSKIDIDSIKSDLFILKKETQQLNDDIKKYDIKMNGIEEENKEIKLQNENLVKHMIGLTVQVNNLESYTRRNNIEISGLEYDANENIYTIVGNLATISGFALDDVEIAHRVNVKKKTKVPSIIVKFKYLKVRDLCLTYAKKNKIMSKELKSDAKMSKIYIKEHLPLYTKKLIYQAKQLKKSLYWKYLWIKNGVIFMRKDDNSEIYRVVSETDLSRNN